MDVTSWRRVGSGLVTIGLAASAAVLLAPSPASAYGADLSQRWQEVDTDDCQPLGGQIPVHTEPDGCRLNDGIDGTLFEFDSDAVAFKAVFRNGDAVVAKVEFHPLDEVLWVYDTANDGDTIYVSIVAQGLGPVGWDSPLYSAPGTNNTIDVAVFDLAGPSGNGDIPEGWNVMGIFYDDAAKSERVGRALTGVS